MPEILFGDDSPLELPCRDSIFEEIIYFFYRSILGFREPEEAPSYGDERKTCTRFMSVRIS
jgi:hypothetical protein